MLIIMDVPYLTEKEASLRYGYSCSWFAHRRQMGNGPKCVQLIKNGRVLYPMDSTDEWFRVRMMEREE